MAFIVEKTKYFLMEMQDVFISGIGYLIPCLFRWVYRLKIKKDLVPIVFKDGSGKTATLYQHGKWKVKDGNVRAILLLHGQHCHPFTMLNLADRAQKTFQDPVFSLYVSYDEENLAIHRSLIKQALDYIEKLIKDQGYIFKGIVIVGHSMGAIQGAYRAFVERDPRLLSVISIAGRLKVVDSVYNPCGESLKPSINQTQEVQLRTDFPLYQIVGRQDWNVPLEATLIRKDKGCYHIVEDAMHLNLLFHDETYNKFIEFLKRSLYSK